MAGGHDPGPAPANRLSEANWSVLGLLRFLLAFGIMTTHAGNIVGEVRWIHILPSFGAVAAFFMISGFSIATSHAARPDGFLRRRILRIYPLSTMVAALSLMCLYLMGRAVHSFALGMVHMPSTGQIVSVLLLANGLLFATPAILHPFWSLNCEILYYAAAPWLLTRSTRLLCILFVLSAFLHFLPVDGEILHVYPDALFGQGAISMLWAWLLGIFAYRFHNNQLLVAFAAFVCNFFLVVRGHDAHVLTPLVYAVIALCVCNLKSIKLPGRLVRMGNYLGELSYPLYLVHYPVTLMLGATLMMVVPPLPNVAICWLASMVLSMMLYEFVDRPIRKRRGVLASAQKLETAR